MHTQVLFHNQYLGMHGVFVWFSSLDFPHVMALKQRSTAYMLLEALIYLYIKALFGTPGQNLHLHCRAATIIFIISRNFSK